MLNLINQIVARAKADRQRIVLPEGTEERTLKAANQILTDEVADLILLIFFSFSSSMILIFLPSMVISFSVAKLESVRIAFEVVIFDKFAKSSRER